MEDLIEQTIAEQQELCAQVRDYRKRSLTERIALAQSYRQRQLERWDEQWMPLLEQAMEKERKGARQLWEQLHAGSTPARATMPTKVRARETCHNVLLFACAVAINVATRRFDRKRMDWRSSTWPTLLCFLNMPVDPGRV